MERELEYWLEQEEKWEEKQGDVDEHVWYPKMIEIYQNLVRLMPKEPSCRIWLACNGYFFGLLSGHQLVTGFFIQYKQQRKGVML